MHIAGRKRFCFNDMATVFAPEYIPFAEEVFGCKAPSGFCSASVRPECLFRAFLRFYGCGNLPYFCELRFLRQFSGFFCVCLNKRTGEKGKPKLPIRKFFTFCLPV